MIAEAILARCANGKHTHLRKVSAHSGVMGNEMADELAKARGGEPEADADDNGETKVCPAPSRTPMHELY
jgi:ribonuclease HI